MTKEQIIEELKRIESALKRHGKACKDMADFEKKNRKIATYHGENGRASAYRHAETKIWLLLHEISKEEA